MKLNTPFPGRRRAASSSKHEALETPVTKAKEAREEAKRPILKLKKRGK